MREELRGLLTHQGYKVVGDHAAVKLCHWTREDLKSGGRHCYKGDFYGIQSHRCLQMTPIVDYCNFRCLYCWRSQDFDTTGPRVWDEPGQILEGALEAQRQILTGYKTAPRTDMEKWLDANQPKHVAISLNGEPTAYPHLPEFIRLCRDRGMTTFLVTNGSFPETIRRLEREDALPTQIYVSVDAPNKEIFDKLCVPLTTNAWEKMTETLRICSTLDTRVVARHTLVKGWNMGHYEEYVELDRLADADFVECKGYVFVGYSRERMTMENMPSHSDIQQFSRRLAAELGYTFEAERSDSRVALLVKPGVNRWLEGFGPYASAGDAPEDPLDVAGTPQGLGGVQPSVLLSRPPAKASAVGDALPVSGSGGGCCNH